MKKLRGLPLPYVNQLCGICIIPSITESPFFNSSYSDWLVFIITLELIAVLIYFKYIRGNSEFAKNNKYMKSILSSKIYKATKEVNAIPTMHPKVLAFHTNKYVRIFRVIGSLSFLILAFSYYDLFILPDYLKTLLYSLVMIHFPYSILVSLHSLYYILKAFIRGDFIYRN